MTLNQHTLGRPPAAGLGWLASAGNPNEARRREEQAAGLSPAAPCRPRSLNAAVSAELTGRNRGGLAERVGFLLVAASAALGVVILVAALAWSIQGWPMLDQLARQALR